MKIVLLVLASLAYINAQNYNDTMKSVTNCVAKLKKDFPKIGDAEIKEVNTMTKLTSQGSKCLSACVNKDLKMMTNDNKINMTSVMALDSPNKTKIIAAAKNCTSVTDANECEAAFKITNCVYGFLGSS